MATQYTSYYEMQKENTGAEGAWNSFAKIVKDSPKAKGKGYVESVKIHWILDDRNAEGGTDPLLHGCIGTLFAAAYQNTLTGYDEEADDDTLVSDNIISIRAGQHAGNVTLPIKRRINQEGFDVLEADGDIYLWMKNTDVTNDDTLVWRIFIEVTGRWVDAVPL